MIYVQLQRRSFVFFTLVQFIVEDKSQRFMDSVGCVSFVRNANETCRPQEPEIKGMNHFLPCQLKIRDWTISC